MTQLQPHQTCFTQGAGKDARRPSVAIFRSVTPSTVDRFDRLLPDVPSRWTPPLDAASDTSEAI